MTHTKGIKVEDPEIKACFFDVGRIGEGRIIIIRGLESLER